jgi:hypothetical protein
MFSRRASSAERVMASERDCEFFHEQVKDEIVA